MQSITINPNSDHTHMDDTIRINKSDCPTDVWLSVNMQSQSTQEENPTGYVGHIVYWTQSEGE